MHTHPMEQSSFLPLKYIMPKYILGGKKKKSQYHIYNANWKVVYSHPGHWKGLSGFNQVLCLADGKWCGAVSRCGGQDPPLRVRLCPRLVVCPWAVNLIADGIWVFLWKDPSLPAGVQGSVQSSQK